MPGRPARVCGTAHPGAPGRFPDFMPRLSWRKECSGCYNQKWQIKRTTSAVQLIRCGRERPPAMMRSTNGRSADSSSPPVNGVGKPRRLTATIRTGTLETMIHRTSTGFAGDVTWMLTGGSLHSGRWPRAQRLTRLSLQSRASSAAGHQSRRAKAGAEPVTISGCGTDGIARRLICGRALARRRTATRPRQTASGRPSREQGILARKPGGWD